MKRVVRLTENDIARIVNKVIKEQVAVTSGSVLDTVKTVFSDAVKGKISGIDAALKQFPNSRVFFVLDPKTGTQRYFQYTKDGSKLIRIWNCSNGRMYF